MDGVEVDTDRLRDKVANLSGLLVTTMGVVEQLRKLTIAQAAFGSIGLDVHKISKQVQDQAGANIAAAAAVLQSLNRRSTNFAGDVDNIAKRDQARICAVRPTRRLPEGN